MSVLRKGIHSKIPPRTTFGSHQLQQRLIRERRIFVWSLLEKVFPHRQSPHAFEGSLGPEITIERLPMSVLREKFLRVFTAEHSRPNSYQYVWASEIVRRILCWFHLFQGKSRICVTGKIAEKDFPHLEHWRSTGKITRIRQEAMERSNSILTTFFPLDEYTPAKSLTHAQCAETNLLRRRHSTGTWGRTQAGRITNATFAEKHLSRTRNWKLTCFTTTGRMRSYVTCVASSSTGKRDYASTLSTSTSRWDSLGIQCDFVSEWLFHLLENNADVPHVQQAVYAQRRLESSCRDSYRREGAFV